MMVIMPRNFGEDKILEDVEVIPTLDARTGTGGNNVPMVLDINDEQEKANNTDRKEVLRMA